MAEEEKREQHEKFEDHDFAAFHRFMGEFRGESDRAAVVLGAAKLDLLLYQLLQKFFKPSASRVDELLDGDSPLGTFSAKIAIAHRLDLISDDLCRALHIVRRIRSVRSRNEWRQLRERRSSRSN